MSENIRKLFPGLVFNDDTGVIIWKSGPWVSYYGGKISLDDAYTTEQLRALADWIEKHP